MDIIAIYSIIIKGMNITVAASIFIVYGTFIVLYFLVNRKYGSRVYKTAFINSVICYSVCLFALTMLPSGKGNGSNFIPFVNFLKKTDSGRAFVPGHFGSYLLNATLNILLFIPFGLFFAIRFRLNCVRRPVLRVLLYAAAVALGIELLQLILPLKRFADIDDVIYNAAGAVIGAFIFNRIQRRPFVTRCLKYLRLSGDVDEIYS